MEQPISSLMMSSTILLAEDNDDDAFLMIHAFRKAHLLNPVVRVKGGEEAVAYLKGEKHFSDRERFPMPFLLLLDLNMPGMDGFEVLKWARAKPELKQMLIVILTTSTRAPDMDKAFELGANSYLSKPGGFEELVQLLTRLHGYWLITGAAPDVEIAKEMELA